MEVKTVFFPFFFSYIFPFMEPFHCTEIFKSAEEQQKEDIEVRRRHLGQKNKLYYNVP